MDKKDEISREKVKNDKNDDHKQNSIKKKSSTARKAPVKTSKETVKKKIKNTRGYLKRSNKKA